MLPKPSLKLVRLEDESIIKCLEQLLEQAHKGKIVGFTYVAKHAPYVHTMGILGGYEENPVCALRVVSKLADVLNERAESMEVWG